MKDRSDIDSDRAGMSGVDVRDLRYFLAVAEERHFGRAAERLHIAQPALSRAIRRLEARVGVELFVRTTREVELTAAGTVLLREAPVALGAVGRAVRRTRRAADAPRLVVALKPDGDLGLLEPILDAFASRPHAVAVEVALASGTRAADLVRDGEADVALVAGPFSTAGLASEELRREQRVVVLAATHPLAAAEPLTLADLAGETLPAWAGLDPLLEAHYAGRDGATAAELPAPVYGDRVDDLSGVLRLVGLERCIAFLPRSVAERYGRPGVVVRDLAALTPTRLRVVWAEGSTDRATAAFVRTAIELAAR